MGRGTERHEGGTGGLNVCIQGFERSEIGLTHRGRVERHNRRVEGFERIGPVGQSSRKRINVGIARNAARGEVCRLGPPPIGHRAKARRRGRLRERCRRRRGLCERLDGRHHRGVVGSIGQLNRMVGRANRSHGLNRSGQLGRDDLGEHDHIGRIRDRLPVDFTRAGERVGTVRLEGVGIAVECHTLFGTHRDRCGRLGIGEHTVDEEQASHRQLSPFVAFSLYARRWNGHHRPGGCRAVIAPIRAAIAAIRAAVITAIRAAVITAIRATVATIPTIRTAVARRAIARITRTHRTGRTVGFPVVVAARTKKEGAIEIACGLPRARPSNTDGTVFGIDPPSHPKCRLPASRGASLRAVAVARSGELRP